MKKFNTVYVDSLDIYKGQNEKTEDIIAEQARAIAERNGLRVGDSINADIAFKSHGEENEIITTVTYDGKSLIVEGGYKAEKFDKVYTKHELEKAYTDEELEQR